MKWPMRVLSLLYVSFCIVTGSTTLDADFATNRQGLLQGLAPLFTYFLHSYRNYVKYLMWTGVVLLEASLVMAAFATNVRSSRSPRPT
jgi:hypothetical protein